MSVQSQNFLKRRTARTTVNMVAEMARALLVLALSSAFWLFSRSSELAWRSCLLYFLITASVLWVPSQKGRFLEALQPQRYSVLVSLAVNLWGWIPVPLCCRQEKGPVSMEDSRLFFPFSFSQFLEICIQFLEIEISIEISATPPSLIHDFPRGTCQSILGCAGCPVILKSIQKKKKKKKKMIQKSKKSKKSHVYNPIN